MVLKNCSKFKEMNIGNVIKNNRIKVSIVENNEAIANDISSIMVKKLKENNKHGKVTSFILPVGPRNQYIKFAETCNIENISCKNLITINMDEYLDTNGQYISIDSPLSFRGFMKRNLFNRLNQNIEMKSDNILFPDPNNIDNLEEIIEELNGVDICFGGVGINGHIAFNEPIKENSMSLEQFRRTRTRVLDISRDTIIINSIRYGGDTNIIPRKCITIGMYEILRSKELRFYLEHDWQAYVLKRIVFGEVGPSFPATFIREHKNSSLIISKNVFKKYTNMYSNNN